MNVRRYQVEDEESVIRLWMDCGLVVSHNNPIRDIQRKLRVNPEWFLVGEIDGRVVATCMAGYEGHRGWINYLAVSPARQRTGLASQIMARAEELLRAAGCPKINLQIRSSNRQVIEFYKSIGFKIDSVVSMGKRLEPDEPYKVEPGASANRAERGR
ncbi:MAG TPA: GNAT family acetyltransferase [Verrucomicrobiae bacterium]|mgnify:CR=1 FL=1|nr:GNAT family acetyltransferase [Verrucomicrobiae bacterium]